MYSPTFKFGGGSVVLRRNGAFRVRVKTKALIGISDPCEAPKIPELKLDTENLDVDYCAQQVILKLENMGLVRG